MFLRINQALNDRRAGLKREEGFTLIELLVVVIIIGILAAIAIPVFLGVQSTAKDSAVKADLTNIKTAIVAYETQNPSVDVTTITLATLGSTVTIDTSNYKTAPVIRSISATGFCVDAVGANNNPFSVTDKTAPVGNLCS